MGFIYMRCPKQANVMDTERGIGDSIGRGCGEMENDP